MNTDPGPWTAERLDWLLDRFEEELRDAGLKENSVRTYVDRSRYFVCWLADAYEPRRR
jgi:hypothetical protein